MNKVMIQNTLVKIEMPFSSSQFKLPKGVNNRLQKLLDRQDKGLKLTSAEKKEAEGLVDLSEMLSLLRKHAKAIQPIALEESANLYAETYEQDRDLQELN
jgi:hypothetical protein